MKARWPQIRSMAMVGDSQTVLHVTGTGADEKTERKGVRWRKVIETAKERERQTERKGERKTGKRKTGKRENVSTFISVDFWRSAFASLDILQMRELEPFFSARAVDLQVRFYLLLFNYLFSSPWRAMDQEKESQERKQY